MARCCDGWLGGWSLDARWGGVELAAEESEWGGGEEDAACHWAGCAEEEEVGHCGGGGGLKVLGVVCE